MRSAALDGVVEDLVHDRAHRVESRIASGVAAALIRGVIAGEVAQVVAHAGLDHDAELGFQLGLVGRRVDRAQNGRGEPPELRRVVLGLLQRPDQVGEKGLDIPSRRAAVDAIGRCAEPDLGRMAGRARQAQPAPARATAGDKPHRQPVRVSSARRSDARYRYLSMFWLSRNKVVVVSLFQREEPVVRQNLRPCDVK